MTWEPEEAVVAWAVAVVLADDLVVKSAQKWKGEEGRLRSPQKAEMNNFLGELVEGSEGQVLMRVALRNALSHCFGATRMGWWKKTTEGRGKMRRKSWKMRE